MNIGIIGTGLVAREHASAIASIGGQTKLIAATDASSERLEEFCGAFQIERSYDSAEKLLADDRVELVTVATPPNSHEELVVAALDAGKFVLCEKPLAHTLQSARRILAAEARHPGRLAVSYQFRYDSSFRRLQWFVENGWLCADDRMELRAGNRGKRTGFHARRGSVHCAIATSKNRGHRAAMNVTEQSTFDAPTTLIIGRYGRLAKAFRNLFPNVRTISRPNVDIGCMNSVEAMFEAYRPRIVVNCAAMTDLDRCEREPDAARRVNVTGVANIAAQARQSECVSVHFSSDYAIDPVNEYGRTKRDSEGFADLTIRAKIYDGTHWAWQMLRAGRAVDMTTEEFSNPVSTTTVAAIVPMLLRKGLSGVRGLGSRDRLSFYAVGQTWARVLGAPLELVRPAGKITSNYRRLADTFLSCAALQSEGIAVPDLVEDASRHKMLFESYRCCLA